MQPQPTTRRIFTVSELTAQIKVLLEEQFAFVWLSGEISNFRRPTSGHFYFTLKDDAAQIGAVMFRGQTRNLKFMPSDGMAVTGLGRISLYEPRGTYQVILEYLEPKGAGELQVAFEQLKARLAAEGLFDAHNKKSLPFLPNKIIIITSISGAVVHDITRVVGKRYPGIAMEILPVKVQGPGAIEEIVDALQFANRRADGDVIILARGGGSLEDLQAFNAEAVARAIFASKIPVVAAIGHETDFTIADFVSDVRAPTPSAAAEMVVPRKTELLQRQAELKRLLTMHAVNQLSRQRSVLDDLSRRLKDPRRRIADLYLRIDDLGARLVRASRNHRQRLAELLRWKTEKLLLSSPRRLLDKFNEKLDIYTTNLSNNYNKYILNKSASLDVLQATLGSLNPKAILARGYSITRTLPDCNIVHTAQQVTRGQVLEVLLHQGRLVVDVSAADADFPAIEPGMPEAT